MTFHLICFNFDSFTNIILLRNQITHRNQCVGQRQKGTSAQYLIIARQLRYISRKKKNYFLGVFKNKRYIQGHDNQHKSPDRVIGSWPGHKITLQLSPLYSCVVYNGKEKLAYFSPRSKQNWYPLTRVGQGHVPIDSIG